MSIDISPLLDWAVAILGFAVDYVWLFCVITVMSILLLGMRDRIVEIIKSWRARSKGRRENVRRTRLE